MIRNTPVTKAACFFPLLFISFFVHAQQVVEPVKHPKEWTQEFPPFRIAGNLFYVGTYDLACYLVATPKGNILINTGLASSAMQIKASIERLGYKFEDTKILLTTQAHYDHLGAMQAVRKMTGAVCMINEPDVAVAADGGKSDYALGGAVSSYQPVTADKVLHDGDSISLGGTTLIMLNHPGHTKGSCSYKVTVKDHEQTYRVLIANLPTIVTDRKFADISEYPGIERDYMSTLAAMKDLKFDLWVASHASQFNLHTKHKPGDAYRPAAFADQKGYDEAIEELRRDLETKRLQK